MNLITITIFFLLSLFNFTCGNKRITYPPFLFCFIWFFILSARSIFIEFYLTDIYDINTETYFLFISGGMVTTLAGFLSMAVQPAQAKNRLREESESINVINLAELSSSYKLRLGITIAVIFLFPFYFYRIIEIVRNSEIENVFLSLRWETSINGLDFGVFNYLIPFSCLVALLNYNAYWEEKSKRNTYLFIISLIMALIYAVTTMGRTGIMMIITVLLSMYFISAARIKFRKILMGATGFIIVFMIIGVLLQKGGDVRNKLEDNINSSVEGVGAYLFLPINALDEKIIRQPSEVRDEKKSLRFFTVVLNKLGLLEVSKESLSLVDEFVYVPYPMNVYTFYYTYVQDFGFVYALAFLFLMIFWHTCLFFKVHREPNCFLPRIYYCLLFYPLVMTFFNDQYIIILSTWIQLFLETYIFYLLTRVNINTQISRVKFRN